MLQTRFPYTGRSLKSHRHDVPSLDTSQGRSGVLLQVLPVVCSSSGLPKTRRLSYLNAAVRAIQQLNSNRRNTIGSSEKKKKNDYIEENFTLLGANTKKAVCNEICENEKNIDLDVKNNINLFEKDPSTSGLLQNDYIILSPENCIVHGEAEIFVETLHLNYKNSQNEYYNPQRENKSSFTCSTVPNECNLASTGSHVDSQLAQDVSHTKVDASSKADSSPIHVDRQSPKAGVRQQDDNGLDFREGPFTLQEYFCMLRCCLVCDGQEVRAAGLRLLRYLLDSPQDAQALCCSNIIHLVVRSLDTAGGGHAMERLQALRLLRRLLQVFSTVSDDNATEVEDSPGAPAKTVSDFPPALVACVISLTRAGGQERDNLMYPALAVLTELVIIHPETTLACGGMTALQSCLLECGGVPRIHESLLAALLRLANTPRHRLHTRHLLQVLAPYTDHLYSHVPYDVKNLTSSEERDLRLSSARLCLLLLLRSWAGLALVMRDRLAALRCITSRLAHSPHVASTTAIISLLYELFSLREGAYFARDGGGAGDTDHHYYYHRLQGGALECEEWRAAVTAHLAEPAIDADACSLYDGFVAAEARATLPSLVRCRPNLVQGTLSLVLHALIKADLLAALCHVIINSTTPLAIRTTILLGELVHRAHQDLPVECSQLTHALPELMNQAATNYRQLAVSVTDSPATALKQHGVYGNSHAYHDQHQNVHSSNPTVNVDLNNIDFAAGVKHSSEQLGSGSFVPPPPLPVPPPSGVASANSTKAGHCLQNPPLHATLTPVPVQAASYLPPADPFSIPRGTCVINGTTAQLTQVQRRARASLAINALLQVSRGRLTPPALPPNHSLYLAHLLHALPYAGSTSATLGGAAGRGEGGAGQLQQAYLRRRTVTTPASDLTRMSKWLSGGSEHEELTQQTIKRCHVMRQGHDQHLWNWDLVMALLRWPSDSLQRISSSTHRLFVKRLVHFFKPSAELFSKASQDHRRARQEAEALVLLVLFLLQVPEADSGHHLEELLLDLASHLRQVACKQPPHDLLLSVSALNTTCAHYYFLMVGVLSRSSRGHLLVGQAGVFQLLYDIMTEVTSTDVYVKLVTSSLDYSIDGMNRTILCTVLRSPNSSEGSRVYGTQLLRALLRTHTCPHTLRWLLQQLVLQLYDIHAQVYLTALSILYEVTEVPHLLQSFVRAPPLLPPRLGSHLHLLTARMLQTASAYQAYDRCGLVDRLLEFWDTSFCVKYVQLQEWAVSESLTQHRRDESGRYGRRTSAPHTVTDVFAYPHLYGALAQHRRGRVRLAQHPKLAEMMETLALGRADTPRAVWVLKAAVWGVCHAGSSCGGARHLWRCGSLRHVARLAATCPVYSVRGACCMAMSCVAVTPAGVAALRELGWESVVRDHHQLWQSNLHPLCSDLQLRQQQQHYLAHHQLHLQQPQLQRSAKSELAAPYYTALKDGNYIGHSRRPGFFLSGGSEDDDDGEEEEDEEVGGVEEEDDSDDGGSFIVDGIGLDSPVLTAPDRKAQTLPNKGRTPCRGHQRSLSDCAAAMDDTSGGAEDSAALNCDCSNHRCTDSSSATPRRRHHDHASATSARAWVRRGSLRLKHKILSSMKKRSERKRLDSTASTTSSSKSRQYCQHTCSDSSPSPRLLDTPTPPPLTPHSLSSCYPSSPFFPATSPSDPPATFATALRCGSALQSVSLQPHYRHRQSVTSLSSGGTSPVSYSVMSSRRDSLDSSCNLHNHTKVDVGVQLSPIASGGSLSVASADLLDDKRSTAAPIMRSPYDAAEAMKPSKPGKISPRLQQQTEMLYLSDGDRTSVNTAATCMRNACSQTGTLSALEMVVDGNVSSPDSRVNFKTDQQPPVCSSVYSGAGLFSLGRTCTCSVSKVSSPGLTLPGLLSSSAVVYSNGGSVAPTANCCSLPGTSSNTLMYSALSNHYYQCCSKPHGETSVFPMLRGDIGKMSHGLPRNASQGSMVSVSSSVSLQGCQVLLAMSEQRRAASETQHQQDQRKRDYLTTLLTDTREHHGPVMLRGICTVDGRSNYSRATLGIGRMSSSGSLALPLGVPIPNSMTSSSYVTSCNDGWNVTLAMDASTGSGSGAAAAAATTTITNNKFSDATYSSSIDNYFSYNDDILKSDRFGPVNPMAMSGDSESSKCNCRFPVGGYDGEVSFCHCAPVVGNLASPRVANSSSCHCTTATSHLPNNQFHHVAGVISPLGTGWCPCEDDLSVPPPSSARVWGHKTAYPMPTCGPRYIGLCIPLDLDLLLCTENDWDDPVIKRQQKELSQHKEERTVRPEQELGNEKDKGDSVSNDREYRRISGNSDKEEEREEAAAGDCDKWRESKEEAAGRLETVKEESFNSGDGENSLQSVSLSTAVDSCRTSTTTVINTASTLTNDLTSSINTSSTVTTTRSETGLTLHCKANCLGCFSLCHRREVTQPLGAGVAFTSTGSTAALLRTPRTESRGVSSGKPETPADKWECTENQGVPGAAVGRADEGWVLVRKEVLHLVTRMSVPYTVKSAEAGLLILKQRWPVVFRDVCLYSEVSEMMATATYSLAARHFVQEMFVDVPFTEVFEEAECLMRKGGLAPATVTSAARTSSGAAAASRKWNDFTENRRRGGILREAEPSPTALQERPMPRAAAVDADLFVGFNTDGQWEGASGRKEGRRGDGCILEEEVSKDCVGWRRKDKQSVVLSDASGGDAVTVTTPDEITTTATTTTSPPSTSSTPQTGATTPSSPTTRTEATTATAASVAAGDVDCSGGIVLLTVGSSGADGDLTLSDWEGLSTDDDSN